MDCKQKKAKKDLRKIIKIISADKIESSNYQNAFSAGDDLMANYKDKLQPYIFRLLELQSLPFNLLTQIKYKITIIEIMNILGINIKKA